MLAVVLQMGNYINAAKCDQSTMKGFSVESLATLANFKTGQVSSLHFICLTLRKDASFLTDIKADLQHVSEASRLNAEHLNGLANAFQKDKNLIENQVKVFQGQEGHERQ